MENKIIEIAQKAKQSALKMAQISSDLKNEVLLKIAENIEFNKQKIFKANEQDITFAQENNISSALLGRLKLDENKLRDMVQGVKDVASLDEPINKILSETELDEGLTLKKISCPIGVLGIIFEARPDVISQISALAIKSSNVVILKGGKEATNTNKIIAKIINDTLNTFSDFPKNVINLVFSREDIQEMLKLDNYIDLIIPRGSNQLVKYIKENTKIPVLGHADGICHIFVDKYADINKALNICIDAKTQYPSACNAVETILIHKEIAEKFLHEFNRLCQENEITLKGCERTCKILSNIENANNEDWKTEYSAKIVSVKIMDTLENAIEHINFYGSHHTDCIITENFQNAEIFMNNVDSAGVYHNVSTRFADGFRYGFGAEIGISTNKTHARGPVGLEGLTIYKYKLYGNGQIVKDYANGTKSFTHKKILHN